MTGADNAIDPADQAGAIENPSRAADAILMLEEDLGETKDTKFLWFLLALLQRDKIGIKLNRARELDWEDPLLEKPDSTTEAEIERSRIVAQYSDNPMIQLRIVNDLNEIPDMFTLHRTLLKALSENVHLGESVTRSSCSLWDLAKNTFAPMPAQGTARGVPVARQNFARARRAPGESPGVTACLICEASGYLSPESP